jgi:rubredoxin
MTYSCVICGHIHDEAVDGPWSELDDTFMCPDCGAGKQDYEPVELQ